MAYFVPTTTEFDNAVKDRTSPRYLKILIDTNGDDVLEDLTSYLDNNQVSGGGRLEGDLGGTKQYSVRLKNSSQVFHEGDFAGAACAIEAKVGVGTSYIRIFTGFVAEEGCQRDKLNLTSDTVTLQFQDASKSRGMNRKTLPITYVNHKICDTVTPSASLFHKLAYQLGLVAADLETATIDHTKGYLPLEGKSTVWQELQDLASQYLGHLYFRYDGKLRLISRHQQGWSEPTSEWTFDDTNIHRWTGKSTGIACNRVRTEFEYYENLGQRVIYKNTDSWDQANERNAIEVAAGAYWPGPNAQDKAQLHYKDPASGESFLVGISIQTPTIGAVGSASDIECSGGLLTLVSFNGSTGDTQQNPGSSEIILRNNTGGTITIRKFEIRGTALRVAKKIVVEDLDSAISDDWEWVDKTIPGKYAVSDTQAHVTTQRWVEFGKVKRKLFDFTTDWIPQIQEGAVVTFHPDADINMNAVVESFAHDCAGSPRKWTTKIQLREKESFTPSGSPKLIVQAQGEASTETAQEFVTHQELLDGFDNAPSGGTTTPTQVTVGLCRGFFKGIELKWDRQLNLTNFDHYEIQVSDDQVTWYSLKFDGTDWKDQVGGVTSWQAEILFHTNIPFDGSAEIPTGKLLYYHVRRVTKAPAQGTWSAIVSATTEALVTGDYAAYQLTAYKLDGYARSQHGVFLEVFEAPPSEWNNWAGSGTETIQNDVGVCGGKAYQTAGYRRRTFHKNIPFDPSKQYRLRCRVRRTATSDAAKQQFYCGIEGVRADGVMLCNQTGIDSYGSQHYICANRDGSTWTLNEWQTFTGWFKGTAVTGEGTEHPNGNDPAKLHENVRYIRPLFIMNYSNGPVGNVMQLDYIAIDVFDEDELYRTYAGLNVDGTVAANKVVANSILANAVETAKLNALAVTGDKIAANTISTNKLIAAEIATMLLSATSAVIVGQDYEGTPPAGAQRVVCDDNELRLDEYNGSSWDVIFRVGGDDMLKWYLQARGLIKTGTDISGVEVGDGAPSGTQIFDFENDYQNKAGSDPWDSKIDLVFSALSKFGSYALTASAATGRLTETAALGIPGVDFGLSFWHYKPVRTTDRVLFQAVKTMKQIGSGLSLAGISYPVLAELNSTDVAFIDGLIDELRTYRFNGSTWSLVGSGLSIPGIGAPALAALNSTDVAFIDHALDELRTYRFNGSTWSLVGSGLSIPGIDVPALAALNSTDVAFIDYTLESLRTYRFNGSTWSLVGSGLSIPGIDVPALAELNSTDVAFIDYALKSLRTYRFNGSTWSLVGSGLSIPGIGFPALAALNSTDVAFIDHALDELRTYRFNGSTWSLVGSGLSIPGIGFPALAALNSTDVAFIDDALESLRTYRLAGMVLWETSTGYKLIIDGTVEQTGAATETQWHHVGLTSRDVAGQKKWGLAVDAWSVETNIAAYPVVSGAWLDIFLDTSARVDDFASLATSALLSLAEMLSHYAIGQPWVDASTGIDALLDLFLMAKSGGTIKLLSPTGYYSPVAGEPSLGTPHEHHKVIYTNASLAANANPTIDLSGDVPAGVTLVFVWYACYFGGGGNTWLKNTAETVKYAKVRQNANVHAGAQAFVTLDSSRKFKFVNEVAVSELDMELTYYWY
jgi:hypothetical protein